MPHLLRYKYQIGDRQKFRVTASMLMHDTELGELLGRVSHQVEFHILSQAEGSWLVECSRRLLHEEGELALHMPAEQREDRKFQFKLLDTGLLKDLGQGLPGRLPCFPDEPKDLGEGWDVAQSVPGEATSSTRYDFAELEERAGDLQADILCRASGTQGHGDDAVQVDVQGVATFSVSKGKPVSSRTQLNTSWADGRQVQTVLEMELG